MKTQTSDIFLTALAPIIWGSTYIITTEFLSGFSPILIALLRALPAGVLLLMVVRQLPKGFWWVRVFILGALNFSLFWYLLFVSAYRLPGGVAATVGSVQPLIVIFLAALIFGGGIRWLSIVAGLIGLGGVALLVLTSHATLDGLGALAGLAGAVSMAFGTVLTRYWRPPVSLLTFTAWQLTAGGLLLLPVVLITETALPPLAWSNLVGLLWLGLVGAALTYILWFRGIARLDPAVLSSLGFLSPVTAVLLGWVFLNQSLTAFQIAGFFCVTGSIWLNQQASRRRS